MNPRLIAVTVLAPGLMLAAVAPVRAEDECTKLIIYAVKQFCSLLPNGQSLCQPVALTGPSPACEVPAGTQLKPIALAPPSVQGPFGPVAPFAPYTPFPPVALPGYMPGSFAPPQLAMPQFALPQVAPPQVMPAQPVPAPTPPTASAQIPATPPASAAADMTATVPAPAAAPAAAPASTPQASAAPVENTPAPGVAPQTETVAVKPAVVVEDALAHFAFDSAELTEVGRQTLDAWLSNAPVGMPVLIKGYADRLGPEPYNLKLSQRRAEAARDYLISKGKDARDLRIAAKGEANPVKRCKGGATPATKACLAPNRRVEITPE